MIGNVCKPLFQTGVPTVCEKPHHHRPLSLSTKAIDDDCNQTGQMTAGFLDWPQVRLEWGAPAEAEAGSMDCVPPHPHPSAGKLLQHAGRGGCQLGPWLPPACHMLHTPPPTYQARPCPGPLYVLFPQPGRRFPQVTQGFYPFPSNRHSSGIAPPGRPSSPPFHEIPMSLPDPSFPSPCPYQSSKNASHTRDMKF